MTLLLLHALKLEQNNEKKKREIARIQFGPFPAQHKNDGCLAVAFGLWRSFTRRSLLFLKGYSELVCNEEIGNCVLLKAIIVQSNNGIVG